MYYTGPNFYSNVPCPSDMYQNKIRLISLYDMKSIPTNRYRLDEYYISEPSVLKYENVFFSSQSSANETLTLSRKVKKPSKKECTHGTVRKHKKLHSNTPDMTTIRYIETNSSLASSSFTNDNACFMNYFNSYVPEQCFQRDTCNAKIYNKNSKNETLKLKSQFKKSQPIRSKSINSIFETNQKNSLRSKSKTNENSLTNGSEEDTSSRSKKTSKSTLSSFSSEFKQIENQKNEINKSETQNMSKPPPPPPPPAPPLDLNLLKPLTTHKFTRLNKVKREADEETTKGFDAVVNELKTKLNKIRASNENLTKIDTLLHKTPTTTMSSDRSNESNKNKSKKSLNDLAELIKNEKSKLKHVDQDLDISNLSKLFGTLNLKDKNKIDKNELTYQAIDLAANVMNNQSNSSLNSTGAKVTSNQNGKIFKKKSWLSSSSNSNSEQTTSNPNLDMTHLSSSSTNSQNLLGTILDNRQIKGPVPASSGNNQEISSSNKIVNSVANSFKLELLNDSEDELSDDYNKYDRVKFSPTNRKVFFNSSSALEKEEVKQMCSTNSSISTQNSNGSASKLASFSFRDKTNQILKKIQKRNTFALPKSSTTKIPIDVLNEDKEKQHENRLFKSKSDYLNLNRNTTGLNSNNQNDSLRLIKIESLVDLSLDQSLPKSNMIAAFSTRNLFQNFDSEKINDKNEEEIVSKEVKQCSIKNEFKPQYLFRMQQNQEPTIAVKSKSEAKLPDSANQITMSEKIIKPIAKGSSTQSNHHYDSLNNRKLTLPKENSNGYSTLENINQEKNSGLKTMPNKLIPSKYTSFTDLTKTKPNQSLFHNIPVKNLKSINENKSSAFISLIGRSSTECLSNKKLSNIISIFEERDKIEETTFMDFNSFNMNSFKSMSFAYNAQNLQNQETLNEEAMEDRDLKEYLDRVSNYYNNLHFYPKS